jgi:DNA mismatch endonuclease (patch repair protein)
MFRLPAARAEFWAEKIAKNRARDAASTDRLLASGWRVLTIWECSLRGPARRNLADITTAVRGFISGADAQAEIKGEWNP